MKVYKGYKEIEIKDIKGVKYNRICNRNLEKVCRYIEAIKKEGIKKTFEVIQEEGDFVYVNVKVEQNNYTGYVYRYYITSNSPQIVYPVFNGNVRVDKAIIYDMDFNPTQYTASKNQGVFIYEGFSSDEYTAIQLILEDGSLYNGYIKTVDLTPQGISPLLILGISIIAACVTIILSLLFIKKRKKK